MSLFEDPHYRWRETYFIYFPADHRPSLDKTCQTLSMLGDHFELTNASADNRGRFESITIRARDEFAAIDVSYLEGDEVTEQVAQLAREVAHGCCVENESSKLAVLRRASARLDLLHFEEVTDEEESEDEPEGMLDPSALLLVLDALAELCEGVAVDPQTGTLM